MEMKRMTAAEQIYHEIYSRIILLELKPGENLNVKQMLNEVGVSRSPLRDALLKLQDDNLVEIFPQKGSRVSKINLNQLEVERFMRTTLELAAVPLFAQKCIKEDLLKMRSAIESQKIAMEGNNFKDFLIADDEFHEVIFAGIGMERIWNITKNQSGNYRRFRVLSSFVSRILSDIVDEHEDIVKAFTNKDADLVLKLDRAHLTKVHTELDILQREYPDYFE